jgi:hypothetical protein
VEVYLQLADTDVVLLKKLGGNDVQTLQRLSAATG